MGFLGLIRLQDMLQESLLRLEKQVGGELVQLTREMAGKIDEQLIFLQDRGLSARMAMLSVPPEERSRGALSPKVRSRATLIGAVPCGSPHSKGTCHRHQIRP